MALIVLAVMLKLRNQLEPVGFVFWLASIVAFILTFCRRPQGRFFIRQKVAAAHLALAAIVVLAFALRWVNLDGFPPNVDGDEAVTGINARQLLHGLNTNWLGTAWMGFPSPSFLAHSFSMSLFGDNLHGLRMGSVVSGVAAVITSYLLVSLLFGRAPGLLTALLMATSQVTI
ncbi:MAG: glycosyltransferase family 39 protein, partial [Chloroflexota bacterium]